MKITPTMPDQAVLEEMGERLASRRLGRRQTQAELAQQAGISLRTVKRIEAGQSAQAASLVRVLRALGLLENLEALAPEAAATPMAQLKLQGKRPRRVRGRTARQAASPAWTWGDEK